MAYRRDLRSPETMTGPPGWSVKTISPPHAKRGVKVEAQIKEEISNGRYIVTRDKPLVISALGAIPKPDSGDLRLIHDCSRPEGLGVKARKVSV